MGNKQDYYAILGVARASDDAEIKAAYRKLAKQYHPDSNPGDKDAEEKFKEISVAYAVLSDVKKRADYDRHGTVGQAGKGRASGTRGADSWPFEGKFGMTDADFDDILGELFGGLGRCKTKGKASASTKAEQGSDVKASVSISRAESSTDTYKEVPYSYMEPCNLCGLSGAASVETCERCKGAGVVRISTRSAFGKTTRTQKCPSCGGNGMGSSSSKDSCRSCLGVGFVKRNKVIEVKIPGGIRNGQSIRLKGMGDFGKGGGARGDLMVCVTIGGLK